MITHLRLNNTALWFRILLVAGGGLVLALLTLTLYSQTTDTNGKILLVGMVSSPLLLASVWGLWGRGRKNDSALAEPGLDTGLLLPVLDAMPEAVVYAVDGAVVYANPALYHLFERQNNNHRDTSTIQRLLRGILVQHSAIHGEYRLQRTDGSEFDASVTTARVPGTDGTNAVVAVIRDITSEKDLLAQRTRMMSNAAHELRTPIANFKTRLYLLRRQPEKLEEHLTVIEESADHMQHMIDDMLEQARFERGVVQLNRQDTILQDLVQEVLEKLKVIMNRQTIQLTTKFPETPLHVFVDANRTQAIDLESNGERHEPHPKGGKIEIEVQARRSENPDYPGYALIHVRDNGVGVPSDLLAQVFQPFEAAAQGSTVVTGTALGLSLAKEIAELHGGEITATSEMGKGSTFSVKLLLMED